MINTSREEKLARLERLSSKKGIMTDQRRTLHDQNLGGPDQLAHLRTFGFRKIRIRI